MCQKILLIQIQLMQVLVKIKAIFSDIRMVLALFSVNQVLDHQAQRLEYI